MRKIAKKNSQEFEAAPSPAITGHLVTRKGLVSRIGCADLES